MHSSNRATILFNECRGELERAQHQSRQFTARMASSNLMIQNAEAASAQQTAAAAAAEHRAEKLDCKLTDIQWELEQCQRQLEDKTAQTEHQMKVCFVAGCDARHVCKKVQTLPALPAFHTPSAVLLPAAQPQGSIADPKDLAGHGKVACYSSFMCVHLSVHVSVCLVGCLDVRLCICLCLCLSISLFIFLAVCTYTQRGRGYRNACCWGAGDVLMQERDSVIEKLRSSMHELGLRCEAATAQAQAAQPYERRYRDLQACSFHCHAVPCACTVTPGL